MATVAQIVTILNSKMRFAVAGTFEVHPTDATLSVGEVYYNEVVGNAIVEHSIALLVEKYGGAGEKAYARNAPFDLAETGVFTRADEPAIRAALEAQHPGTYRRVSITVDSDYATITVAALAGETFVPRRFIAYKIGSAWKVTQES